MDVCSSSQGLVSVIIPFLNGSEWLIEALESVINQTYTNWEIILIDDGSTKYHSEVAKNFCNQHPEKIFYYEHEGHVNKGVSISRNEAVKFANGKYLAFLDADDVWMPAKLANHLLHFINYKEIQVVCDSYIIWNSWQDKNAKDFIQQIGVQLNHMYHPGILNALLYPLQQTTCPAPSGVMITKEAFERVKGFEPAFSGIYELYEDQAFFSKIYLKEVVYISGMASVLYRKRSDSMSSAANNLERYNLVRVFYFDWLENYMQENKLYSKEITDLVKHSRKALEFNKISEASLL